VSKKIHRRGRREAQRFVVFLCVPLRSLTGPDIIAIDKDAMKKFEKK